MSVVSPPASHGETARAARAGGGASLTRRTAAHVTPPPIAAFVSGVGIKFINSNNNRKTEVQTRSGSISTELRGWSLGPRRNGLAGGIAKSGMHPGTPPRLTMLLRVLCTGPRDKHQVDFVLVGLILTSKRSGAPTRTRLAWAMLGTPIRC